MVINSNWNMFQILFVLKLYKTKLDLENGIGR